jgi:hypothetical protein
VLHDRLAHALHLPIGEKFQHGFTREQIYQDQNFAIVHAVEMYPVSLPRQKQFLPRSWVEILMQPLLSPISPDAPGASRANCLDGCIHSWPIVQRVQKVMHLGVALMMNLGIRTLDERLLLLNGNYDPLPRVSIRGNSQQFVRISLHHLQISFSIKIPFGNFLS